MSNPPTRAIPASRFLEAGYSDHKQPSTGAAKARLILHQSELIFLFATRLRLWPSAS